MKNYNLEFKWFVPVMIKIEGTKKWQPHMLRTVEYIITDPRWTDIWNVFQFDIYIEDEYYATYKANYEDLEIAVGVKDLIGFEIKKLKTDLPIPVRFSHQFEPKKINRSLKK